MDDVIDAAQVRRIAALARLTLGEGEVAQLAGDMSRILAHVRKLGELDTRDVPPTAHAVDLPTALRDDEVRPGLPLERALQNAPERIGDGFGVPKIIE